MSALKTRIISGVVATAILAVVLVLGMQYNVVLTIAFVLATAMAVWEILENTKLVTNRVVTVLSMVFSALMLLSYSGWLPISIYLVQTVYVVALLWMTIFLHKSLKITQAVLAGAFTMFLSFAFMSLLALLSSGAVRGLFYFILVGCFAWGSDIGAYFTGVFFGKHKLCPLISPKKTVEGAIGGIVVCMLLSCITAILFVCFGKLDVSVWLVLAISPFFSVAGMFGDLTASVLKRQCGIKDYGTIMPGHGGVLDRFDSILMIAPLFYLLTMLTMHI